MTKEEKTAHNKAYQKSHREEIAARKKAHYRAHREEELVRMKAYRQAHRAEYAASTMAWAKAHPDKVLDRNARHRALKRGATVETVSRVVVYERDAGRCHICGKKVPKRAWHLDHIVPLFRGGEHSYLNVAVACEKCNLTKHTKAGAQLRLI